MATLKQKIAAEEHVRELLERENVPEPDRIEYGYTCIRLIWDGPKVALVVDIDRPPDVDEPPPPAVDEPSEPADLNAPPDGK